MTPDYSRSALIAFLDFAQQKGLANKNSALGMKVAAEKILSDLSPEEEGDVRKVDIAIATRRFHNKNPNQLSPSSLSVYQRRVAQAIREFLKYREDPTRYVGFGKNVSPKAEVTERQRRKAEPRDEEHRSGKVEPVTTSLPSSGLSIPFPLRADFLAQVVIPRDLRESEAKRLSDFIATLVVGPRQAN